MSLDFVFYLCILEGSLVHSGFIFAKAGNKTLVVVVITWVQRKADGTDVLCQLELLLQEEDRKVVQVT